MADLSLYAETRARQLAEAQQEYSDALAAFDAHTERYGTPPDMGHRLDTRLNEATTDLARRQRAVTQEAIEADAQRNDDVMREAAERQAEAKRLSMADPPPVPPIGHPAGSRHVVQGTVAIVTEKSSHRADTMGPADVYRYHSTPYPGYVAANSITSDHLVEGTTRTTIKDAPIMLVEDSALGVKWANDVSISVAAPVPRVGVTSSTRQSHAWVPLATKTQTDVLVEERPPALTNDRTLQNWNNCDGVMVGFDDNLRDTYTPEEFTKARCAMLWIIAESDGARVSVIKGASSGRAAAELDVALDVFSGDQVHLTSKRYNSTKPLGGSSLIPTGEDPHCLAGLSGDAHNTYWYVGTLGYTEEYFESPNPHDDLQDDISIPVSLREDKSPYWQLGVISRMTLKVEQPDTILDELKRVLLRQVQPQVKISANACFNELHFTLFVFPREMMSVELLGPIRKVFENVKKLIGIVEQVIDLFRTASDLFHVGRNGLRTGFRHPPGHERAGKINKDALVALTKKTGEVYKNIEKFNPESELEPLIDLRLDVYAPPVIPPARPGLGNKHLASILLTLSTFFDDDDASVRLACQYRRCAAPSTHRVGLWWEVETRFVLLDLNLAVEVPLLEHLPGPIGIAIVVLNRFLRLVNVDPVNLFLTLRVQLKVTVQLGIAVDQDRRCTGNGEINVLREAGLGLELRISSAASVSVEGVLVGEISGLVWARAPAPTNDLDRGGIDVALTGETRVKAVCKAEAHLGMWDAEWEGESIIWSSGPLGAVDRAGQPVKVNLLTF